MKTSLIAMTLLIFLSGCGQTEPDAPTFSTVMQSEDTTVSAPPTQTFVKPDQSPDTHTVPAATDQPISSLPVDVDLTQMSSTMLYSEVYQMLLDPDGYIGKVVKVSGQFAVYDSNPQMDLLAEHYFAVLVEDATACCQQGLEFVWTGTHTYPDDYPEIGQTITVTGIFETYEEYGSTYIHLVCDEIQIEE